ncbi:hypothetical protein HOLleu_40437 [Holothuria leucospilota]|uniref:Uncharacterized protein n=1 Tax=Holothuria leucospilota TaxID=206669 RepID=A0A9Q0YDL7_HOLLE|nr:hypothetical protein HOLleu_40437 [Holothuria leucospilota]
MMGRPKGAEGAERGRSAFRTAWDVGARVRAICEFQGQHNELYLNVLEVNECWKAASNMDEVERTEKVRQGGPKLKL